MEVEDDEVGGSKPPVRNSALVVRVFAQVAETIEQLDDESRSRVLKLLATHFGMAGIAAPVVAGSVRPPVGDTDPAAGSFSEDRTPGPKEFMATKRPQTDVERVTCLAYYLTHYQGQRHFKTVDLSKLNTEAAQLRLSNAAQAVENASKAGLLVPAVKGHKQISILGESYVQALPDRKAARDAIATDRPRRKASRGKRASPNGDEASELETTS